MKPYLAEYLRERDLRGFREILAGITAPRPGDCRRVVLRCFEVLIPALRHQFPLVSEAEMWDLALARVSELDIAADLDELEGRRQRERFRQLLADFAARTREAPGILRPGFLENLSAFRQKFPAILEGEMRALAEEAFGEDSEFELIPDESEPQGPPRPDLVDEPSPNCPRRPASVDALRRLCAGPRAPRPEGPR